jgi:hypothetical protein
MHSDEENESISRPRRRLRMFGYHLACYFLVMALLVSLNLLTTPQTPWFAVPLVCWGGVLAAHVAYVMGLFPTKRGPDGNA